MHRFKYFFYFVSNMYIPRNHSLFIRSIFPHISCIGIDLGNIEIKETTTNMYTLTMKDHLAEFLLCYSFCNHVFCIIDNSQITYESKKFGKRQKNIEKHALYRIRDNCIKEMVTIINSMLKSSKFNGVYENV